MIQQTSLQAYQDLDWGLKQENHKKIMDCLAYHICLTDREIQQKTGLPINVITPRRGELTKMKPNMRDPLVVEQTRRICTIGKKKAIVWQINDCYLLAWLNRGVEK